MNTVGFKFKKLISLVLSLILIVSFCFSYDLKNNMAKASSVTGEDMAAWAMRAYNEGWQYVYGSASVGEVDCSGLIASLGVGGNRCSMMSSSPETGSISTIPDIPGLGLYMPGHVGVYVGGGMAVDARNEYDGVCYSSISNMRWTNWFKIYGVDYSDNSVSYNSYDDEDLSYSYSDSSQIYSSDNASTISVVDNNLIQPQKPTEIKLNDCGIDVQIIQTRLGELGYYVGTDTGYFGVYTETCLKEFQNKAGLNITGIADDETLRLLSSEDAPSNIPPTYGIGMVADEITDIQRRLVQLEYLAADSANGYYGEDTYKAIADFQTAASLDITGNADPKTVEYLNSDSSVMNPKSIVLQKGCSGDNVIALQNRLSDLRYLTTSATGVFDDNTELAVKNYQLASGIEQTGYLDRSQLEVINSNSAIKSPEFNNLRLGFKGEDIKSLQNKLIDLGYLQGEADGYFDERTETAVKSFEDSRSMKETGVVTLSVRMALNAAVNSKNISQTSCKTKGTSPIGLSSVEDDEVESLDNGYITVISLLLIAFLICVSIIFFIKNPKIIRDIKIRIKFAKVLKNKK